METSILMASEECQQHPDQHLQRQTHATASEASSSTPTSNSPASAFGSKPQVNQALVLPDSLEMIPKAVSFSSQRHRWNTNEEIASLLIAFDKHEEWLSKEVTVRSVST